MNSNSGDIVRYSIRLHRGVHDDIIDYIEENFTRNERKGALVLLLRMGVLQVSRTQKHAEEKNNAQKKTVLQNKSPQNKKNREVEKNLDNGIVKMSEEDLEIFRDENFGGFIDTEN